MQDIVPKKFNVVLDSQVFFKKNYNFENEEFKTLVDRVNQSHVKVFISEMTIEESKRHIRDKIEEAYKKLKSAKDQFSRLHLEPDFLNNFESTSEDMVQKKINAFTSFIMDLSFIELKTEDADLKWIQSQYIERKPPFHNEKKAKEFPDAITISSLLTKFKSRKHYEIYIVSQDKDFARVNEIDPTFHYIEELSEFLNIIAEEHTPGNSHKDVKNAVHNWLNNKWSCEKHHLISILDAAVKNASFQDYGATLINWEAEIKDASMYTNKDGEAKSLVKYLTIKENSIKFTAIIKCPCEFHLDYIIKTSSGDERKQVKRVQDLYIKPIISGSLSASKEFVMKDIKLQDDRFEIVEELLSYL